MAIYESWRDGKCVVQTEGELQRHLRHEASYCTAEAYDGELATFRVERVPVTSICDPPPIVKELDELLETQGRLLFAKQNYNEDSAEAFGVQLLDFFARNGVAIRTAMLSPNT